MNWQYRLIALYLYICKSYDEKLRHLLVRESNNSDLSFSDAEVMTIYIWGVMKKRSKISEIYEYANENLRDWFPNLPNYHAFVQRLNKISHLFEVLTACIFSEFPKELHRPELARIIDSMPIILAQNGRRFKACVAQEIASASGFCAAKNLYFYGVRLHMMGAYSQGNLPVPEYFCVLDAGFADIRAYEQIAEILPEGTRVFADKAYQSAGKPVHDKQNHALFTPVKKKKGQKALDSADKLLSSAISSVRQPIESLFNWIEDKTKIQFASKVRSYQGLMVHIFGKLATAFLILTEKFSS